MVVNYYEELNLNKADSLDEITHALNQLESTWKRREITSPEKAIKMLALINDARSVFATEQSRSEYNSSLMARQENVVQSPSEQFDKAWAEVESFFDSKQWDLSKMAFEKALPLMDAAELDTERAERVYAIGQEIYLENGQYEQAIDFANRYISIMPDFWIPYYNKQVILSKYIEFLRGQNLDASQYINNYRTTCQVWAKVSRNQNDNRATSNALSSLSVSYVSYPPIDYDLAENLAKEALELDPKNSGAKSVIQWLYQPREVPLEELDSYAGEASIYEQDILNLVNQIVASGLSPETDKGWMLTKKDFYGWYNPDNHGNDNEEGQKTTYLLSPDGKFIKWVEEHRETIYKDGRFNQNDNDYIEDCSVEELMLETDFEAYCRHNNGQGWEERTSFASSVRFYSWTYIITREVKRLYRKKGQGLYDKLKDIMDRNASYVEECNRINAAFNGEWEPMKQAVSEKYSAQREQLVQEQDSQIEQARSMEPQRQNIQSQIQSSQNEMASLGFFSGKRKKELQASIAQLEQQLWHMPTVDSVKSAYQKKLDDLNHQESAELQRTEQELRSKYPLPKQ